MEELEIIYQDEHIVAINKPTSGVLLFALSKEVARALSEQILAHGFTKEYLAVVRGYIAQSGLIDYPLKELLDKMTDAKAKQDKPAQRAVTDFEKIDQIELPFTVGRYSTTRYSLVRLQPQTGRKYQLRRHMKHLLHPIVGDTKYGRNEHNCFFREQYDAHRLLLHADSLTFIHPVLEKKIVLRAGLDETFTRVLEKMEMVFDKQYLLTTVEIGR